MNLVGTLMNAKSMLPFLRGETATHRGADEWLGYELFGNSAVFQGDYKAVRLGAWLQSLGLQEAGAWRLYNIKEDPSELHDLSTQEPALLSQLTSHYADYSKDLGIIDVPADFNPAKALIEEH